MNRVCLIIVLLAGLLMLVPIASLAASSDGDKIGTIDSQNVITQHPDFKEAMEELQRISRKIENEARIAAEKESDDARKAQVIREKRMELAKEEQRLMEPIVQDAQHCVRAIARIKGITVVLEKASVYVGGTDITQDVAQELQKYVIQKKGGAGSNTSQSGSRTRSGGGGPSAGEKPQK